MQSAVNFKKSIFLEITQYIELDVCGVPLHPASAPRIGGQKYSEIVLHHLTIRQFATIVHLTGLFSGVVGSYHNAWLQAPGCPGLGCLLQVRGAGEGRNFQIPLKA